MTVTGTSVRRWCVVSALFVGLIPACQQGAAPEDRPSARRSSILALPQPGDTIVLDFSTDALGNPLTRGTVLGEQFAAAGIHFTGGYILGDRTIDFSSYLNTPAPDILICTRDGGDPGGCGATQDRPAAGVPLGITLDYPVCYASIVGRSVTFGSQPGKVSFQAFDGAGVPNGGGTSRDIYPQAIFPFVNDPVTGLLEVSEGAGIAFMPYSILGPPGNPQQGLDVHSLQISEMAVGSLDDLTLVRCTGLQPKCKNQVVCTSSALGCIGTAPVNVDNGSYNASNDQPVTVSQSPGPPYPLGYTNVVLSVSQGSATATCAGGVTVGDCSAPAIVCPPPLTLPCAALPAGCTLHTDLVTVSDSCHTQPQPIGDTTECLQVGTNALNYSAASVSGARSSCSTSITIVDDVPPIVTGPGIENGSVPALSPVDGMLHTVVLSECQISVTDACDNQISRDSPYTKITCASSNEDGLCVQMSDDIQVIYDGMEVRLRAKNNAGGISRVYTVHFESKDRSGNAASGDCYFAVPGTSGQGGVGDAGAGGAAGIGGEGGGDAMTVDGGATGGIGGGGGASGGTEGADAGSADASAGGMGQNGGHAGGGGSGARPDGSTGEDAGGGRPPPHRAHGCSVDGGAPLENGWFTFAFGASLAFGRRCRRRR